MTIRLIHNGLEIDGRAVPLLSGSMHYWRVSRSLWNECLNKVRALGLRGVCTYVPWSAHEVEEGRFDFGDQVPERDLVAFIRAVHEAGLFLILRPGPHINAELSGFGYPERILRSPRMQAQGPEGAPVILPAFPQAFAVPSYASEPFWREVGIWFDAVAERIVPWLYPRGPIVMVQCDNECSYFFRTGAYEQDYSDGARSAFRAFLQDKYKTTGDLDAAYGKVPDGFAVRPPTAFRARRAADLPAYLDWVEFKERLIGDALVRIRNEWEARGVRGVLFSHNLPFNRGRTPFNIPRDERELDTVGMDFYPRRTDYAVFKSQLLGYEGQSAFPWSPEFSSGCYQLAPPIVLDDMRFTTDAALMHGLRGFNFYMAVERERWFGSPITRKGGYRPDTERFYRDWIALVERERLFDARRRASALVLIPRLYDRLEKASHLVGHFTNMVLEWFAGADALCSEERFGMAYCVAIEHDRIRRAVIEGLEAAGVTYRVGDSESGPELWHEHSLIFCPTFEFLDRALQENLRTALQKGASLVMGPEAPSLDEGLREFGLLDGYLGRPVHKLDCAVETLVFNAEGGRLFLVGAPLAPGDPDSAACVEAIARFVRVGPEFPVNPPLDRAIHEGGDGRVLLYLANPTPESHLARFGLPRASRLRDLRTAEVFVGETEARISIEPWTVRLFEVTPC